MLGAGIEPAWEFVPRDFKSLASTGFATRAARVESARRRRGKKPALQRKKRQLARNCRRKMRCYEAGNGIRTRDPNLGKVVLYQLSYSRGNEKATGEKTRQQPSAN